MAIITTPMIARAIRAPVAAIALLMRAFIFHLQTPGFWPGPLLPCRAIAWGAWGGMTILRPRVRCGHARTLALGVAVGCKGSGSHTFAIWCRGVNIGVRAITPVLQMYATTRA